MLPERIQTMLEHSHPASASLTSRTDSNSSVFISLSASLSPWLHRLRLHSRRADSPFRDITAQAGIHFVHNNGAFGKNGCRRRMGPGCAFIDYDNDGYPDILLVNGEDWPGHAKTARPR